MRNIRSYHLLENHLRKNSLKVIQVHVWVMLSQKHEDFRKFNFQRLVGWHLLALIVKVFNDADVDLFKKVSDGHHPQLL